MEQEQTESEQIYEELMQKVQLQGIGFRNFEKGIFCAIFELDESLYFLDNIKYMKMNETYWDVRESKVYHYTVPREKEEETICHYCNYAYETEKPLSKELLCENLSKEPFLTAIWATCVHSSTFHETYEQLVKQINPSKIVSETVGNSKRNQRVLQDIENKSEKTKDEKSK